MLRRTYCPVTLLTSLTFGLLAIPPLLSAAPGAERLGTVSFATSCAASVQQSFNRGVALLHDFWYDEAQRQFEQIAKTDSACGMAHWGIAMSLFHQIWNRPTPETIDEGWREIQKAQAAASKTEREREYISALGIFYQPGKQQFEARVQAYSDSMRDLSRNHPDDTDAAAFYALSLLASTKENDTSLEKNRQALAVMTPLFSKFPDHPGLAHYIIHACDNPAMAAQALEAAQRYGEIAPSAAHSAHMPGHIFARLGMWQPDIDANLKSVAAGEKASAEKGGGMAGQLHAYNFLLYAYLQSGQDAKARKVVDSAATLLTHSSHMGDMPGMDMSLLVPMYRAQFPSFFALEMRDWKSAAQLTPEPAAPPEAQIVTYWARIIAEGHLRDAAAAAADLSRYQACIEQIKKGKYAYFANSTAAHITDMQVAAWSAFAKGDREYALTRMRAASDLQDKVGQGEVDIPAREMLADMLAELHQPQQALVEFEIALKQSPNRLNGLLNAGKAAEAAGDKSRAAAYYTTLMKVTANGVDSNRIEFAHVKEFLSTEQIARQ